MALSRSVKVTVGGQELHLIVSDSESSEYILKVAEQADNRINYLLENNEKLSTIKAAVLTCVNLVDELNKAGETIDNLREQMQKYISELSARKMKKQAAPDADTQMP